MYKLLIATVSLSLAYNLHAATDEEITAKIIKKYNLPQDVMERDTVPLGEIKGKIKERVKAEVKPKVKEQFPDSKQVEVKQEAEKKFPLIKQGDEISVKAMRGNRIEIISGRYKGQGSRKIVVGDKEILIDDIRDDTKKRINPVDVGKLRRDYFRNNFTRPKSAFERPLIKEIEKEEYGKAGYIYNKRVLKWVAGKKVIQAMLDKMNKKTEVAARNEEESSKKPVDTTIAKKEENIEALIAKIPDVKEDPEKAAAEKAKEEEAKKKALLKGKMSVEKFAKTKLLRTSGKVITRKFGKGNMVKWNKHKTYVTMTFTVQVSNGNIYTVTIGFRQKGKDFFGHRLTIRKNIDSNVPADQAFDPAIQKMILSSNSLGGKWPEEFKPVMLVKEPVAIQGTVTSSRMLIIDNGRH